MGGRAASRNDVRRELLAVMASRDSQKEPASVKPLTSVESAMSTMDKVESLTSEEAAGPPVKKKKKKSKNTVMMEPVLHDVAYCPVSNFLTFVTDIVECSHV